MSQEHIQDRELEMAVSATCFPVTCYEWIQHNPQALQGHRALTQLAIVSCLSTGTAIPLIPATPLIFLTAQFPLPSCRRKGQSLSPLSRLQCCRNCSQKACLPPPSQFSWSRWRTGHLTTLGLTLRGEWKPMPTCFLALQMKLKQFEITLPHSVSKAAKHSLLSPQSATIPLLSPATDLFLMNLLSLSCLTEGQPLVEVPLYVHTENKWQLIA